MKTREEINAHARDTTMSVTSSIQPRPNGVTVFPDRKVYYFEGWGKDVRAEVFVRKVRAAGRRASVASCGSVDYTMVTVRAGGA